MNIKLFKQICKADQYKLKSILTKFLISKGYEVILGLNKVVNNQTIMPYFDTSRIRCNKRCNFGKCDICGAVENLGKALEEKGVGLTRKKATHDERDIDEKDMWNEPAAIISLDDEVSEET